MNPFADLTLEGVFTGATFAGVPASPVQLAITRASQCRPLDGVIDREMMVRHFGTDELDPAIVPTLVVLICGVRAGKSWLASCAAICASLTADLSRLRGFELPRYPIIGPDIDAATATFGILVGIVESSPVLSRLVEGEPTADTLVLRRPDGKRVEICVVAAARGGKTVRNRWLIGLILEEVAQIGEAATGAAISAEEIWKAAKHRLLPGCQAWFISSPFGPQGLLHDLWKKHFGHPGRTLVVHSDTRSMNPSYPQAAVDEAYSEDHDAAARELGALWVDAESTYLDSKLVDAATRIEPLVVLPPFGLACHCAGDFATRGNAWTIVVASAVSRTALEAAALKTIVNRTYRRLEGNWQTGRRYVEYEPSPDDLLADGWTPLCGTFTDVEERLPQPPSDVNEPDRVEVTVLAAFEWIGSKQAPLSPRAVFEEMATELAPFDINTIKVDRWSFDAMQDHARASGFELVETESGEVNAAYGKLKSLLGSGDLELPPVANVRTDLLGIKKRATSGGISIVLTKQANGRHCDFAPSTALAVAEAFNCPGGSGIASDPTDIDTIPRSRWESLPGCGF